MRDSGLAWILCCGSLLASGSALASASPLPAAAFPTPAPAPFAIALSDLHVADNQPHFAFDRRGNSIRVWTQWNDTELATDVMAEQLDADGVPRGAAFQVNTYTHSWQSYPAVAMNARGRCVVAWQSLGQDGQISGLYAQIFTAAGSRFGGEIPVSSIYPQQSANLATVGIDRAGNFAVAWYNGTGAFMRLFNPRGAARHQDPVPLFVEQGEQLLRVGLARERPQPRACATRQQNRDYPAARLHHHVVLRDRSDFYRFYFWRI